MSREWKPGDVALWMPSGRKPEVVFYRLDGIRFDEPGWQTAVDGEGYPEDEDLRPLIVLDVAYSSSARETLLRVLRSAHFRETADQIEAQTKPPKPPEPTGLYAVVETSDGCKWFHAKLQGLWHMTNDVKGATGHKPYANLDVVRVLSEGVTP